MNYDIEINKYFRSKTDDTHLMPSDLLISISKKESLRYGENPHQESAYYTALNDDSIWNQIQGKNLSYNNYFDMECAINIVYDFKDTCCAIIKHSNPCGFGLGSNNLEAYNNAVSTDPVSYFGGIVAFNNKIDENVASVMSNVFLECIIGPSFSNKALNILSKKSNLRVIELKKDQLIKKSNKLIIKSVFNGFLYQNKDVIIKNINDFKVVTKRKPTAKELESINIGWRIVKSVKSNAIVIANNYKTLGVGAGQMSRVDSVKIAIRKSQENNLNLSGSIMASDAFFPFSDSLEIAANNGVIGIVQPGGSIKDDKIIEVANKLNIFMLFTSERHFTH
jgi:phosphoribosylaminoimidazolecarboxamide formyltransferase/IMP cyclohydrolase